jgi:hypothetical protein
MRSWPWSGRTVKLKRIYYVSLKPVWTIGLYVGVSDLGSTPTALDKDTVMYGCERNRCLNYCLCLSLPHRQQIMAVILRHILWYLIMPYLRQIFYLSALLHSGCKCLKSLFTTINYISKCAATRVPVLLIHHFIWYSTRGHLMTGSTNPPFSFIPIQKFQTTPSL